MSLSHATTKPLNQSVSFGGFSPEKFSDSPGAKTGISCQISSSTGPKKTSRNKKRLKPKKKKNSPCQSNKNFSPKLRSNFNNPTGTTRNPLVKALKTGPPKDKLKIGHLKLQPLLDGNFLSSFYVRSIFSVGSVF